MFGGAFTSFLSYVSYDRFITPQIVRMMRGDQLFSEGIRLASLQSGGIRKQFDTQIQPLLPAILSEGVKAAQEGKTDADVRQIIRDKVDAAITENITFTNTKTKEECSFLMMNGRCSSMP